MIKHLKPRNKKEILIVKIKEFFNIKRISDWWLFSPKSPRYYEWYRTSILLENEKDWYHIYNIGIINTPFMWKKTYPYTYTTENKEIQKTLATITVIEREWRRKIFKKIKLFNKVIRFIEIRFEPSIGENNPIGYHGKCFTGKTLACDYEMLEGETPLDTLRRMEQERKF